MFKASLETNLKNIFKINKLSFALPSEENEQNVIFVNIKSSKTNFVSTQAKCLVEGELFIYSTIDRLPFGYLNKKLELAKHEDCKDLFFFGFEENMNYGGQVGLIERKAGFIYKYGEDFNPNRGVINEINFTIEGDI